MNPLGITLAVTVATAVAGSVGGALALIVGGGLVRERLTLGKTIAPALMGAIGGALAYATLLGFLDKSEQPLVGGAFFLAAAVGVLITLLATFKGLEIDASKAPIVWIPFGVVMAVCFYLARTMGQEWREKSGFYRGFESVHMLNVLDPSDAMSTPEKAVNYYNQQYGILRAGNEDQGIGKLLTTSTHWDAVWFNENHPLIVKTDAASDITGINKVIQDPKQIKVLALIQSARPIYGKIQTVKEDGDEAIVQMDSGQLVRMHKEGPNWKIRDWLGMRAFVMRQIYEEKEKAGALTDEDRAEKQNDFQKYEQDTKAMAERLGLTYLAFSPYWDEETFKDSGGSLIAKASKKSTGYKSLDAAKPGELVDTREDEKDDEDEPQSLPKQPNVQANANLQSYAPRDPGSVESALSSGSPYPSAGFATPTPAVVHTPVTISQSWSANVSVDVLWQAYFKAVKKVQANDLSGVDDFLACVTNDDRKWFENNASYICALIYPGQPVTPGPQARLSALQTLLRNMPTEEPPSRPGSKTREAIGVTKITYKNRNESYSTMLYQENHRWVLSHPFFVRTYIWNPQLAQYKRAMGIPLSQEEQSVLTTGNAPMVQQVQRFFQQVGFSG